jgi:hypothetical protein
VALICSRAGDAWPSNFLTGQTADPDISVLKQAKRLCETAVKSALRPQVSHERVKLATLSSPSEDNTHI